jgi:hypothetical protein
LLSLTLAYGGYAQTNQPLSNLRQKMMPAATDTLYLDSLSVVPNSVSIPGINRSSYTVDWVKAKLTWKQRPLVDSVLITYRVFPGQLNSTVQRMRFDSVMNFFASQPQVLHRTPGSISESMFDFGNINYNGSFGRGIAFGNQQDVVVNSTLNMQINGYIGDSIQLSAAITDNNIPIQPDGTTQNLNEFDQVYVQFSKRTWKFNVGDIDIRQQQSYFLSFFKRMQGGSFETETTISPKVKNKLLVSGAVAKGKFTRNVFEGLEGNQGPYRLTGANNELFFIVLAGTERVYIDGELLQRGEDQDYVINYNTAEVTFTPKRMITKDKRIQIEFEYADRNYLNPQLYLSDEATFNNRLKVRISAFSNNDAKNSPINQTLDNKQKQFLADLGDSIQFAFYPSASLDTFSTSKILYKKIDTVFNGVVHDSIYVYTTDPQLAKWSLGFIDVGIGKGDYILDGSSAANGKVYIWVQPDTTGRHLGQYEPAIYLVSPKKQQLVSVGADYVFNTHTSLKTEFAMSNYDVNTFSSKDKGNDVGLAGRVVVTDVRKLSSATVGRQIQTDLGYEYVQAQFKPLERLRNVEFNRDWLLPFDAPSADERLFNIGSQLRDLKGNSLLYRFSGYFRNSDYTAFRNSIIHQGNIKGWLLNDQFNYTSMNQSLQSGYFLRPTVDVSRIFPALGHYRFGGSFIMEETKVKYKFFDSLSATSFSFTTWQAYLKSNESKPNKWGFTYASRADKYPVKSQLVKADQSSNYTGFLELMKNEHHQFRLNVNYRKLYILNSAVTTQKPDETLLGRAEYFANTWKGLLTGNILYELGTGQEQKRDYSYVEVPAGQGEYTWIDYNGDGVQQLNEFEIAQFSDQAKFVRIYTPTNEFIKANYLQFNYSFSINPRVYFNPAKSNHFQKFLSKLYFLSSLQISKKEMATGFLLFNPFSSILSDSSLITFGQIFNNSFSFNRFSTKWGFDVVNVRNSAKSFLSYGYETRKLNNWNFKARWNITRTFSVDVNNNTGQNQLVSPAFDNRNYNIMSYSTEPRLVFIKGTTLRASVSYRYENKENTDSIQQAIINSINSEFKYNILSNTSLNVKFTYSQIKYSDPPANVANSTVGYIMLDALQPGQNYIWNVDLTKRLTNFLELNFQYEGRKAATSPTVHIGRAAIRAIF